MLHTTGAMTAIDPQRVAAWITVLRGDRTQGELARDISETTGWSVDRSRVSRYERAALPVGRDVLAKLSEYAAKRDLPAYDPTPPAPVLTGEEDIAAAIREQTVVFEKLIQETQREANEAKRRADLLERLVVSLLAPAVEASPDPAAIRVMREWGEAALANMTSRLPAADPAG